MSKTLGAFTTAAAVLCITACGTTTFTSTWKDPATPTLNPIGRTVAAVFVTRDEAKRRAGEDALAADLTARGAKGVPAYTLVPDSVRGDGEKARAALKAAGANGAVVMRVVGKDQQINDTRRADAGVLQRFWPVLGLRVGHGLSPPTVTTDTIISVETLVYSLTQDKLLWASTSRTTNPNNLDKLINEVADATAKEMAKQGVLAGK